MSVPLYDVSCATYLQILPAVDGFLAKGREHLEQQGVDLDEFVQSKLIEDMLPFQFQVIAVAHHSMGAIKGIEAGTFRPPQDYGEPDYDGLQALIKEALATVQSCTPDTVNGFAGKEVVFKISGNSLPFTAENFVLSFSIPNLMFHAATAYDLLRMRGAPFGKMDFLGQMRMGT